MPRLFIALALPDDLCDRLHLMQGGIAGARWTRRENLHLTLTFIGDINAPDVLEDLDTALLRVAAAPFTLSLAGTGTFAQGSDPLVLWMGVDAPPALATLKKSIDRQLTNAAIPFEQRKYTPHVTMARFKHPDAGAVARFMQEHNLFRSAPFAVDEFVLFESKLRDDGPQYLELARYPLRG